MRHATACRPPRCSTPSRSTASTPRSAVPVATRKRLGPRSASSAFRDEFGQWDPKNQRPELWSLYNGRVRKGEHIRAFPISNWTELDVWQYIRRENLEIPSIYFSHEREVFERDGMLLSTAPFMTLLPGETLARKIVRYRTVGDMSCTGAVESTAANLDAIIEEVAASRITERGATRADDRFTEAAMEDRKKEGYF